MNLADYKGALLARRENLRAQLQEKRKTVLFVEADLIRARREADQVDGALQATELDIAKLDEIAAAAAAKPAVPASRASAAVMQP